MYSSALEVLDEKYVLRLNVVNDTLNFKDALDLLFWVKSGEKEVASVKAAATAPLQEQILKIRADFATLESILEKNEETLKRRILLENINAEHRRQDAIEEANDAHASGDMEAVKAALLKANDAELQLPPGISLRRQLRFEVTDKSALPIELLKPDDGKIRSALCASKNQHSFPGLKTSYETIVAVRLDACDNQKGEQDEIQ